MDGRLQQNKVNKNNVKQSWMFYNLTLFFEAFFITLVIHAFLCLIKCFL